MSGTERTIERTLRIAAARPQVFRALMDPGALSRWLFATVTLTPEPGSAFSFEWRDTQVPATAQGEILELIPDERLVLSWFMEADGVTSSASFDLADGPDGGTILRFVHGGLPREREWEPRFRAVALEWDKVLLNLRFLLEERGEGKHLFYLRLQASLRAPENRAFRAWTTLAALRTWLAREVFVIPEEDQDLTGVTLDTGLPLRATFQRIEPERHLRMIWNEGDVRSLLGVSIWPGAGGTVLTLTQRSFGIPEEERPKVQAVWEERFRRLESYLTRKPLEKPASGTGVLTFARTLEATPARAWRALTDAALLRRWFAQWTDFEPTAGAVFTFLWNSYGEDRGRITEVHPGESIRFTWDLPEMEETTAVTFRVAPEPDRPAFCRVTLEHSGWGEGPRWDETRSAHESGWSTVFSLLDFYLRHGSGKERREFHLRRRLPLPLDRAVPLFTTAKGLQSWAVARARIGSRADGVFDLEMRGGPHYRGHIVSLRPSGDGAVELDAPVPAFLEWTFAPAGEGSQIGLSLTTYSETEEWLAERRREWAEAMGRLVGR